MARNYADRDDARDDEIVALLQQVGKRLIHSEKERQQLREAISDIEEKADQGERAFLTVQDRISKTEAMLEKRQLALEKMQKEQMAQIEKAAAMADKIEEAISQYAKINHRLDKVAQDKARMIRKLERIEEAVIETQDAVNTNARAVLLLTEQGEGRKTGLPSNLAAGANDAAPANAPWWQQQGPVRAGAVAAMVLLGVFGGWAISHIDMDNGAGRLAQFTPAGRTHVAAVMPPGAALEDYDAAPVTDNSRFAEAIERAVGDHRVTAESPEIETVPAEPESVETERLPDPVRMDDEQLLASLNENPDALASQLNQIATGAGPALAPDVPEKVAPPPAAKPEAKAEKAPSPAKAEPVAFTPQGAAREMAVADFISGQKDKRPLADRIKPDPGLPAVIREVEKKAFEGVPEAQHDLAAIYTAGHGGVEVDYERAALWFRESAIRGIANARYNLGVLYHQGLGVKEDVNLAVNWYRAAAEDGHPEAQYNLGIAYIEGIGTRYNPEKAAYYFEQAARGGILEAAYNLGLIHENGLTGNSRADEALYWYKQASDMGSPEATIAMNQLAKTLGLFPEEIERLYGNKDKRSDAAARKNGVQIKQPAHGGSTYSSNAEFEYLEALPLESEPYLVAAEEAASLSTADHAVTAQIQEQLMRLGLYPGPADGVMDSLTADAIRSYQLRHSLKQDGQPGQALLVHMMTSDLDSNTAAEYGSRAE